MSHGGGAYSPPSIGWAASRLIFLWLLSLPVLLAAPNCLRFADYNNINQAFTDGGPGTKVFLCPSKVYRLTGTITFTAADQELATYGYPTGSERATLLINGDFGTAVQGDCRRCARVAVSNLIVDGSRDRLGRIVDASLATALVVIGGNEGQVVKHCWIRDPRGFTALHVREGDKLQCKGAVIEKNEIGPVGEEFDPEVDGPDPEMSPIGRPLADGVSIACRDSTIRDNTFFDNTDAAIVVYCSPGTMVHANSISTRSRSAMAGILLVDSTPFDGDYTGTTIKGNIIDAAARIIRVGIGLGSAVWSDDTETVLKGGAVTANGLRGKYMGYGIAAAGLKDWTIMDNWDEATHQGVKSDRCFDDPVNPSPMPFVAYPGLITDSKIQSGFAEHPFEYIVCIDGIEPVVQEQRAKLPPMRPVEQATPEIAPEAAVDLEAAGSSQAEFSTGSTVMDEILEHSQTRMLEAIEVLGRRIDILARSADNHSPGHGVKNGQTSISPQVLSTLVALEMRVSAIEARHHALLETAQNLRSSIRTWDQEMSSMSEWQYEVLLDVQHRLNLYLAPANDFGTEEVEHRSHLDSRSYRASNLVSGLTQSDSWTWILRLVLAQSIFGLVVMAARRLWRSGARRKVK